MESDTPSSSASILVDTVNVSCFSLQLVHWVLSSLQQCQLFLCLLIPLQFNGCYIKIYWVLWVADELFFLCDIHTNLDFLGLNPMAQWCLQEK